MSDQKEIIDNDIFDSPEEVETPSQQKGGNQILNDSSVFYKGLFGMIFCIIPAAIVGLVLIKISLEQAKVAIKEYNTNPSLYRLRSINMIRRGRTFARIGLTLFIGELIALVTYMSIN